MTRNTFTGFPSGTFDQIECSMAIVGVPFGTPYTPGELSPSHNAPTAIREESMRYPEDIFSWDFDLDDSLMVNNDSFVINDFGDLPGDVWTAAENRRKAREVVKKFLQKGVNPIVLGGDDSVPIPIFQAYEEFGPINILQIDAHIDWRNEVDGTSEGFSSPMRRASEMPWIDKIIQVGARGTGTARKEEYQAALDYGAKIIKARDLHRAGTKIVLDNIPSDIPCLITIDCDGLDPAVIPGVSSPAPGGLTHFQMIDLIHGVAEKTGLAGFIVVEYVPDKDINNNGAVAVMRFIWNYIGAYKKRLLG